MLEIRLRTAQQLAAELGVSVWNLNRWAQLYGKDSAAGGPPEGGGPPAAHAAAGCRKCPVASETGTISRQRDILKDIGHLGARNRHPLRSDQQMRTEQSCYSFAEMCLALGVSRSGLYVHAQKNQLNNYLSVFLKTDQSLLRGRASHSV
jgi:hypothetical protein